MLSAPDSPYSLVVGGHKNGFNLLNVLSYPSCESFGLFYIIYMYKPVKRFQMKSNGCRDVQHTGLQSTQTRRNTGKQGAQTTGTQHIFPSIPT